MYPTTMDSSLLDDEGEVDKSSGSRLGGEYSSYFRSDYDTRFTADISNKMQMPERLGPVSNQLDSLPSANDDKLFSQAEATLQSFDPTFYMVSTPPRVLTAQDALYSDDEDEDDDGLGGNAADRLYRHYTALNNGLVSRFAAHNRSSDGGTPVRKSDERAELEAAAVPMTPGTLLAVQSGDEMAVIRRQLGKLISHVRRLEEVNQRRQQREYFLYPLVIGFAVFQLAKVIIGYK